MAKGDMSVREAGRLGGERVRDLLGREHYVRIGTLGGRVAAAALGPEGYRRLGRLGGQATLARYGREQLRRWAERGGRATRERGPAYYAEIGQKGVAARRARRERGR